MCGLIFFLLYIFTKTPGPNPVAPHFGRKDVNAGYLPICCSMQLQEELDRDSWLTSADSATVWNKLIEQRDDRTTDPRDAGLKAWSALMGMIGKEDEAKYVSESFSDLTLKEWATESILFNSMLPTLNKSGHIGGLVKCLSPPMPDSVGSAGSTEGIVDLAKRYTNEGLQGCVLR